MPEDQFQRWVQSQIHSVAGDRFLSDSSLKQCDELLQEFTNQCERVSESEQVLQATLKAKRTAREQLMALIPKLHQSKQTARQAPAGVARFRTSPRPVVAKTRCTVPAPGSAPIVSVLPAANCQHVITFAHAGTRGAQPIGSSGAEIYIAVREECPIDDSGFRFAAWAIRSPHILQFSDADAGRTAHYRLRWINAKGESGPWSPTVTAEVPAMTEFI